jgi:pimeloyl-ACP methyl ester carboxylesterase
MIREDCHMSKAKNGLGFSLKTGLLNVAVAALLLAGTAVSSYAFPKDFTGFSGFGGADNLDQTGNRAAVKRIPVILLHGNGGSATHNQWGMTAMRDMLYKQGYNPSEVWAVSYLNGGVELFGVHKNHINDVRNFIEAVKKYLGVQKVDIVSHSLGATMARAYLMGFQSSGKFDPAARRFDSVSTLVTLSGANDGLGPYSMDEFKTGSSFLQGLRIVGNVKDDSPFGSNSADYQKGDDKEVTPIDNNQVTYVAFWACGDFVDQQHSGTGALRGADINKGFSLGMSLTGHERIIKDPQVVSEFLPYLNGHNTNTVQTPKTGAVSQEQALAASKVMANKLDQKFISQSNIDWDGGNGIGGR